MSSRALLVVGVLVLICCCCRGNVDVNMGTPSQSAHTNATAYLDELVSALRREVPSLVPLASSTTDDRVFGTNDDLLGRIDIVMQRYGTNTVQYNEPACRELSYELHGRQSPRLIATVVWVDTAGASDCAVRLRSRPEGSGGTYRFIVQVRVADAYQRT